MESILLTKASPNLKVGNLDLGKLLSAQSKGRQFDFGEVFVSAKHWQKLPQIVKLYFFLPSKIRSAIQEIFAPVNADIWTNCLSQWEQVLSQYLNVAFCQKVCWTILKIPFIFKSDFLKKNSYSHSDSVEQYLQIHKD